MFELLSLVFGGVLRLVPSVLEYLDAKNKRAHELQRMQLASELKQQEIETDAIREASVEQTKRAFIPTGRGWIDALLAITDFVSATVRPVLTYWYCIFGYGAYKAALFISMGGQWSDKVLMLWTPADYSIMLSIIGFWFVDRAIRKMGIK